jgi:tRNA (cytidine32/uridine32-2'-O)-methyltransferase
MPNSIRIVLSHTSHPGNIGAAARAMKTMGLSELYLVAPRSFPDPKANEMAVGAVDVLEQAVVTTSLVEAIADRGLVAGTSARGRSLPWPVLTPQQLAGKVFQEVQSATKVAIVFGAEQSGLTNDELRQCHFHIQIPTRPDYASLNLAAAVQIMAYELYLASLTIETTLEPNVSYATVAEMQGFYEHLACVLIKTGFLDPAAPRRLMPRLQRLFNRARLETTELNILRGILTAIEKR